MAKGNFLKCHVVTEKWEGGWSDHPADPGGKTMYGITLATYRQFYPKATGNDLRNITKANARAIYEQNYWRPVNGETLAAGVDLAVYDAGVNSGISRAKKWLTVSVGGTPAETVKRICAKRLGFMQSLKIWKTFGRGWARRVADIEAKGVAWALAVPGVPVASIKPALKAEATKASTKSSTQAAAGATSSGTGIISGALDQSDNAAAAPNTVLLVILGALVLIGVILLVRSKIHGARSDAYNAEAAKL